MIVMTLVTIVMTVMTRMTRMTAMVTTVTVNLSASVGGAVGSTSSASSQWALLIPLGSGLIVLTRQIRQLRHRRWGYRVLWPLASWATWTFGLPVPPAKKPVGTRQMPHTRPFLFPCVALVRTEKPNSKPNSLVKQMGKLSPRWGKGLA